MKTREFAPGIALESDTLYVGTEPVYHIWPSETMEEIDWWWTILNSGNIPLRAAFVLRGLKNVTVDLAGAKLVFHGRIMPFAVFDCENVRFRNFSIDYDRPFYTQGEVVAAETGSAVIRIPELYGYRVEGHDFVACGETWEHRLVTGDMLFRCFAPATGKPSPHSNVILGLIGDEIHPRPAPPLPIHHLFAEDLGGRCVRISGFPADFRPRVGEILAMTHEDRRKTGFLLERCTDTAIEHVRLLHIGAMGITASRCHNITLNDYSMFIDEACPDRIITINADSFHCFHCTGRMLVENCRFENMLDDAINIHGNYLVCKRRIDERTLAVKNLCSGIRRMEFLAPGDEVNIYRQNTQELRTTAVVERAEFLPDQHEDLLVTFREPIDASVEDGDVLENRRMPEIEVRGCRMKCMGGFRISSGKRVLIEDCDFETSAFSVLFSGDMNYWYENGPVRDVTIRNCRFTGCGAPVLTNCAFQPTAAAPYYHENVRFIGNTVVAPENAVMRLDNVRGIEYRDNRVSGLRDGQTPVVLKNCGDVTIL